MTDWTKDDLNQIRDKVITDGLESAVDAYDDSIKDALFYNNITVDYGKGETEEREQFIDNEKRSWIDYLHRVKGIPAGSIAIFLNIDVKEVEAYIYKLGINPIAEDVDGFVTKKLGHIEANTPDDKTTPEDQGGGPGGKGPK